MNKRYLVLATLAFIIGFAVLNFTVTAGAHTHHECYKDCWQPTNTPTPTLNETSCQQEWKEPCPTLTPTDTPEITQEPTATPSATPVPENHSSSSGGTSEAHAPSAPVCNIPFSAPIVWYSKENGKVTFNWATSEQVDKFAIVYGRTADNLEWGVDNIPANLRSLDINGLEGTTWFQVWSFKNGCAEKSNIIDP